MPILIDQVIAEISDSVTLPAETEPMQLQVPLAVAEQDFMQTLALIQQRRERLKID